MKQLVIIAPHNDDEIIGCYSILKLRIPTIVLFHSDDIIRMEESRKLLDFYDNISLGLFNTSKQLLKSKDTIFFFPDPVKEHHPLHRKLGKIGLDLLDERKLVAFYTTDMNTDYVRELSKQDQENKKNLLDLCYPSQKSLWDFDHKYYLFEGIYMPFSERVLQWLREE